MKIKLNAPQFVNAEVMRATGLSTATVQTWANRGLITPASEKNPGLGQRRLYSLENVIWLAVMGRVTEFGLPVSMAGMIASGFVKLFQGPEFDTLSYRKQPQFGDWDALWCGVFRDSSGQYFLAERPFDIRGDATDEQREVFREKNKGTVMLGIDIIGILVPSIEAIEDILKEREE